MMNDLNLDTKIWLVASRIIAGWLFFYAGISKIFDPNWSAAGFLKGAKTFSGFYSWFAQPNVINQINFINEWALALLGISLIFGIFVRWSTLPGVVLMLAYYFASSPFPVVANGFIVDEHIVYAVILILFFVMNAGVYLGLDSRIWRTKENSGK